MKNTGTTLWIQSGTRKKTANNNKSGRYLVIVGGFFALVLILFLVAIPVRGALAAKYLLLGDNELSNQNYTEASLEYQKSLLLKTLPETEAKLELCSQMQLDITKGEMFFRERDNTEMLEELNQAQKVPSSQSSGLNLMKEYLQNSKPQLAEVVAKNLLEMYGQNANVWLYAGIASYSSAKSLQLSAENYHLKLDQAKNAFMESLKYDSGNELAQQYLKELGE